MIKLLRHLKARFGQKRTAPPPASAPIAEPASQGQLVSRVQQNLAWLPVYQEPEPLNSPPPACPPLGRENESLLIRYRAYIAQVEQADRTTLDEACCQTGRQLAQELLDTAITMASWKADSSPNMYWLIQSAAIASMFADGVQSEAFQRYREHLQHYRKGRLSAGQVSAFDIYVGWHTPKPVRAFLPHPSSETRSPSEPSPTPEDIDELLSYLPRLYPDGVAIKTYVLKENTYWPEYFKVVGDFYRASGKGCWTDFDYINHGAGDMLENDAYIAQANLADIQTMLTYCNRGERFCDGHHGGMIEKGYMLKILRRLNVLRGACTAH
ncbi:hypothetical protein A264_25862 [Pseudomonas syringae pv. actinidiae ICMP 19071]|uniref:DUF6508 domain-containing protein n=1 Tax=Pseudomonas syringae TaxID=317 RepID=UPI000356E77B|nr:DUF6508 domain-containing protein [Pseudomonas syringae]EPM54090.1 hypothetical protein A264_25862 [Pseudomonas syringae pv. actinidiae ICMP 19071]EPM64388.1 hypothetical protein A262_01791 [Pseudomonas syringae pv. actinidiae ICMP 19073]EPM74448.1 hypothetical protein A3SO_25498 [Pseudomonas syringae pv. actinidiae ICMP 19072]OSN61130.1 hypothetical protein BV349_05043 [Pseudomonas syringae pv. actinidiae]OSN71073.1 hypothetical protein BV351_05020 [Pseudomonas syringae pv. actinidiae]